MATLSVRIELDNAVVLSGAMALTSPFVAKVTRRTLNRGQALTPVNTGNLRASQHMTMRVTRTTAVGRVETAVEYAQDVHDGTRPHNIYPKKAGALAFKWAKAGGIQVIVPKKGKAKGPTGLRKSKDGTRVLVISKGFVRHPGTKARPWLYRALKEVAGAEGFIVTPGIG